MLLVSFGRVQGCNTLAADSSPSCSVWSPPGLGLGSGYIELLQDGWPLPYPFSPRRARGEQLCEAM